MEERRGAIGALGAVLLAGSFVAATYSVAAAAGGIASLLHGIAWEEGLAAVRGDAVLLGLSQLGGAGVSIGVGVLVVHGSDTAWRDALGVRATPSLLAVLAIGAGLGLALPLHELALLIAEVVPPLTPDPTASAELARLLRIEGLRTAIVVPLAFVAIPAISEELLFRGLILPGLAARFDRRVALISSALLFGAIHLDPLAFVHASVAGLALGWLRLRVDSVLPAIAMHGAFNAVRVGLPAELIRLRGFNTVEQGVYHLPLGLVLGSLAMMLACLYVFGRLSDDR